MVDALVAKAEQSGLLQPPSQNEGSEQEAQAEAAPSTSEEHSKPCGLPGLVQVRCSLDLHLAFIWECA